MPFCWLRGLGSVAILWCAAGCTRTVYETGPTLPGTRPRLVSETPASAYRAGLARQAGTVVVALRATQCQKHYADEQVAVIHAYREKTLFAGPGLMLGGLALGGAGAGLFVNAKGQPETCADGDDNCVSRDEMVGYG